VGDLLPLSDDVHGLLAKLPDQSIAALFGEFDEIDERGEEVDRAFLLGVGDVPRAKVVDPCCFGESCTVWACLRVRCSGRGWVRVTGGVRICC